MSVPGVKRPAEDQYQVDQPPQKKQKQKHDLPVKQDFPFPKGWTAEWAGEKGRNFVYTAVANSTTLTHAHGPVSVVVQYLRKTDIFGLANLERIAGGKEKLAQLLPGYQPEKPIPEELEHLLQLDLGQLFSRKQIMGNKVLEPFAHIEKVSELFSPYWYPAGMTAKITEDLAKLHGQKFWGDGSDAREDQQRLQPHWNTPAPEGCWILFPNRAFKNGKGNYYTPTKIEAVTPRGFELPHIQEAIFCIFMKYISTRQMVPTQTYCQDAALGRAWVVGPCLEQGDKPCLQIFLPRGNVRANGAGAFMRRFV